MFTARAAAGGVSPHQGGARLDKPVHVASVIPTQAELADRRADMGSNNWVVSGRLTESGMPMVAGDPHRVQEIPSLRYWVHLNAPGWNVIGAGEPSIPGVSYGHNDHGAWGYTIYGADTEDLYVYDINPANPLQYKFGTGWETMRVVHESVAVKGQAAEEVELKFTRHGPVLFEDKVHHKAYAVRAAWLEPGGSPYLATLRVDQAQNWKEFGDAISYARMPALNFVWGDKSGNIGYNAATIAPRRMNFSGLVPVPGDGRYEWNGFLPIKELPHVLNPDKGFYNTSNDWQVPRGLPAHGSDSLCLDRSLSRPRRGGTAGRGEEILRRRHGQSAELQPVDSGTQHRAAAA